MHNALDQFRENIERVRSLGGLANAVAAMTTTAVDVSDILRAQHVLAVSALDHYVHEITRIGMLEIFDGKRIPPPAYLRFKISFEYIVPGLAISRDRIDEEIRIQHSFLSFQQPDKIADAIRLISPIKIWDEVAAYVGISANDVKDRLRLIVDRRNKIAHEADLDPTYPKVRWPILQTDVDQVVSFLVEIVEAINAKVGPTS